MDRTEHGHVTIAELFAKVTKTVPSLNHVRRVVSGHALPNRVPPEPGISRTTLRRGAERAGHRTCMAWTTMSAVAVLAVPAPGRRQGGLTHRF